MGGTTRSTAGKRTDRPAVVRGERNQDQELLLPTAKGPGTVYPVCTRRRSADCVPQQQSADIRIEKNGLHISLPTSITQDTLLALVNALC